jgi:hypothetical protein
VHAVALARRRTTPSRLPFRGAVVVVGVGDMWFVYAVTLTRRWPGSLLIGDLAPFLTALVTLVVLLVVRCMTWPGR